TLPGAITSEEFEARLQELADRTVVAYCTIGRRSSEYVRRMARRGVDMLNLEGSVLAWTHAGGQLVNDGVPTRRLHVYGRRWNLAADGYQTIW
ncbi:MAG: rhodanese-like domain-containing protein, partial [Gemmatimonadota bacterium]|nr:rhodanese-like domain-containing protein [Gemmatimonadota bacterium]